MFENAQTRSAATLAEAMGPSGALTQEIALRLLEVAQSYRDRSAAAFAIDLLPVLWGASESWRSPEQRE